MKKIYKYLFIVLMCFFTTPLITKAECSYERQAELSRIAANVKLSYTYQLQNGSPMFYIQISNLTNDVYLIEIDTSTENRIYGVGEKELQYHYSVKKTFDIYSNDPNCKDEKLMTSYVNTPYFNEFALTEDCQKYPGFKYCGLWDENAKSFTNDELQEKMNEYKQLSKTQEIQTKTKNIDWLESIKIVFDENKHSIVISFIAIMILVSIFVIKKVKK